MHSTTKFKIKKNFKTIFINLKILKSKTCYKIFKINFAI